MQGVERAKQAAAHMAVDECVRSDMIVGIGSGSTVVHVVDRLSKLLQSGSLSNIKCIPTSFQAKQLLLQHNLPITSLEQHPIVDVDVDGADEVDDALNCIKGGGGCQLQEKIVAFSSKAFVIVADSRKNSIRLGEKWKKGVPIEVVPMAYVSLMRVIRERMHGTPTLRIAERKAGPVITDSGNFILDTTFPDMSDPQTLHDSLAVLPGIVDVGLFCKMACKAYFGQDDGSVAVRHASETVWKKANIVSKRIRYR